MLDIQQVLPQARFIHVVRDGRDMALANNIANEQIEAFAAQWAWQIREVKQQGQLLQNYLEIKLEDLLENPAGMAVKLFVFAGIAPSEVAIDKVQQLRWKKTLQAETGAWPAEMTPIIRQLFEAVGGNMLEELGYPTNRRQIIKSPNLNIN